MTSHTARNSAEFLAGHSSHFPSLPPDFWARDSGNSPAIAEGGRLSLRNSQQEAFPAVCWPRPFTLRLSSLVSWCAGHAPGLLCGGENWPSHELCRKACLGQDGAGRGLAGGAVIQRFPELRRRRRRRLGGRAWGSVVSAEGVSPNRILDE